MPYATHWRVIEGFTCASAFAFHLSLCVIYFQCTVHESLGRVYACVLLPVCSIQPTVMCWEALIEYTIWREPPSHLLETQPARKMHSNRFKTANILEFWMADLDVSGGGMSDGK